MNLLEMFKGTGSVGKAAKKLGFKNIVSIDLEKKYNPTILTDILEWDYKKFYEETKFVPDFIWASPPCNTFSPLVYPLKERNTKTAEPYSDRAKLGTEILYKTLEIIGFFINKNPNLGFCIENPRGMMRNDKYMKNLYRETTLYCLYGDVKKKPTDFWANFEMNLKPIDTKCNKELVSVVDLPLDKRYSIPQKLIRDILKSYIENKNL
jgi:site-specific DNA-cytosine methylase